MDAPSDRVCSKASLGGQWLRRARMALLLAIGVFLGAPACARHKPAEAASERKTPSGQPIPRYVSLKFGKVNARQGPGEDYKLLWTYRVKGLPLQVVAETEDWRRVCDPGGQIAWVHRPGVAERRTVMRTDPRDLMLRKAPDDAAAASATLVGRSLADLKVCKDGWCRISAGHASGWVKPGEVWGLAEGPQCRSD